MLLKLLLKFKQSVRFLQNINSNMETEIVIQIKSGGDLKITSPYMTWLLRTPNSLFESSHGEAFKQSLRVTLKAFVLSTSSSVCNTHHKFVTLFLMLLKACFHPDPLTHFDQMSLNQQSCFGGVSTLLEFLALILFCCDPCLVAHLYLMN